MLLKRNKWPTFEVRRTTMEEILHVYVLLHYSLIYIYIYIWFLSFYIKMVIEIPSPWRKHQYLHQLYSRFSNLRSYSGPTSYSLLTFSVTFWLQNVLLSLTVLYISRLHVSHMLTVCAKITLLGYKIGCPRQKLTKILGKLDQSALSDDLEVSSAARRKIDTAEAATKLRNSPRCKSFNSPFVSISA